MTGINNLKFVGIPTLDCASYFSLSAGKRARHLSLLLYQVASYFDVRIVYNDAILPAIAAFEPSSNTVYLRNNLSNEDLIRGLFHEFGHVVCHRNNIYKRYHSGEFIVRHYNNIISGGNLLKEGVDAELYADKLGSSICKTVLGHSWSCNSKQYSAKVRRHLIDQAKLYEAKRTAKDN